MCLFTHASPVQALDELSAQLPSSNGHSTGSLGSSSSTGQSDQAAGYSWGRSLSAVGHASGSGSGSGGASGFGCTPAPAAPPAPPHIEIEGSYGLMPPTSQPNDPYHVGRYTQIYPPRDPVQRARYGQIMAVAADAFPDHRCHCGYCARRRGVKHLQQAAAELRAAAHNLGCSEGASSSGASSQSAGAAGCARAGTQGVRRPVSASHALGIMMGLRPAGGGHMYASALGPNPHRAGTRARRLSGSLIAALDPGSPPSTVPGSGGGCPRSATTPPRPRTRGSSHHSHRTSPTVNQFHWGWRGGGRGCGPDPSWVFWHRCCGGPPSHFPVKRGQGGGSTAELAEAMWPGQLPASHSHTFAHFRTFWCAGEQQQHAPQPAAAPSGCWAGPPTPTPHLCSTLTKAGQK